MQKQLNFHSEDNIKAINYTGCSSAFIVFSIAAVHSIAINKTQYTQPAQKRISPLASIAIHSQKPKRKKNEQKTNKFPNTKYPHIIPYPLSIGCMRGKGERKHSTQRRTHKQTTTAAEPKKSFQKSNGMCLIYRYYRIQ